MSPSHTPVIKYYHFLRPKTKVKLNRPLCVFEHCRRQRPVASLHAPHVVNVATGSVITKAVCACHTCVPLPLSYAFKLRSASKDRRALRLRRVPDGFTAVKLLIIFDILVPQRSDWFLAFSLSSSPLPIPARFRYYRIGLSLSLTKS